MTSRIPLQTEAPPRRRRHLRKATLLGAVVFATVSTTALLQGSAHAERAGYAQSSTTVEISGEPAVLATVESVQTALNDLRAERRLPQLVFDDWMLGPTAQKWAETMAARGHVFHDPELVADYQSSWSTLTESVAAGDSAEKALKTILANQTQASQLFDVKTTTAGIGMQTVDGKTFLVVRFLA